MYRKEINGRAMVAWLLCALSAPVVQLLAGYHVTGIALIGLAATSLVCLVLARETPIAPWMAAAEIVWLTVVLSVCTGGAAEAWPMAANDRIISLTLLALAAWSAWKGPCAAARMAGILLILLSAGYALVLGAGVPELKWRWIRGQELPPIELAGFVFLLPAAGVCLPKQRLGKKGLVLFGIPIFAILATIITNGNVNPQAELPYRGFYEMCRSLSFFGIAQRFEALVCALVTVGWFCLLVFLLSCIGSMSQKLFPGRGPAGVGLGAGGAALLMLGNLHMEVGTLAAGTVIFWVLLPILSQGLGVIKNRRKK